MAKLPAEIRIEINKSMPGHDDDIEDNDQTWELERLLQAFRKELQIGRSVIMYHHPIKRNLLLLVLHSRLDISQQLRLCILEMIK